MKMRRVNKILTAVFLIALLALSVALPMLGSDFLGISANGDLPTALAAAPNGPNGTTYGQLASNSTYVFTDPDKVTSATVTDDTTEITIDTSIPHGTSAKNPYVIDTEARWNQLVTDGASDNSTTSGKYYILTADIAFSTTNQFTAVNYFKGTFYGLGHTFSGLRYTTNSTFTNLSVFRAVTNAVITDLNVKDFIINQSNGSSSTSFSGIAGTCSGPTKIFNCHTSMIASCLGVNKAGRYGGIVGVAQSTASVFDLMFYKCSSKIDVTSTTTPKDQAVVRIGGILGMAVDNCRLTVWNCYGDVKMNVSGNSACYTGSIVGVLMYPKYAAKVEYCAGRLDSASSLESAVGTSADKPAYMIMSLMSVYVRPTSAVADLPSLTVRNTYSIGKAYYDNKTAQLYAIITNRAFFDGNASKTFDNVWTGIFEQPTEWGLLYNSAYEPSHDSYSKRIYDIPTAIREKTCPESELWTKAGTALPSAIWTNIDVLADNDYSVDNTPFKSTKITTSDFKVNLYDKKNTGNDALLYTTTYDYNSNPTLTTPTKTGAIFKGYTFDPAKTTAADLYKNSLNGAYYGNLNLYAVWDVDDSAVSKNYSVTGGTLTSGVYVLEYEYGQNIKLTGNVTYSAMGADAVIEYDWRKGTTTTTSIENQQLTLENVSESDTYTLYYKIHSSTMPLWKSDDWRPVPNAVVQVSITPAPVTLQALNIGSGEHAYVGKSFEDITPVPVVVDAKGNPVEGTADWGTHIYDTIEDMDIDGDTKLDGKMKQKFNFVPTDSNYASLTDCEGILDVEYITISFVLPSGFGTITANLEYAQLYMYKHIAELFDTAYKKDMGNTPFPNGRIPQITINGQPYAINDLRTNTATAFQTVTDNISLNVEFVQGTYTVTFDANKGGGVADKDTLTGLSYGKRIAAPSPDPTNGTLMFLGWYHDVYDKDGNKTGTVLWDFAKDVVTENITLTAQWLEPSLLKSITVKAKPGATFTALTSLTTDQIIVTATFECKLPDNTTDEITTEVLISKDNVTFDYVGNDSEYDTTLHVGQNPDGTTTTVTVTYSQSIDGIKQSASADLIITVEPELVPTDNWQLKDQTFIYDGNPKSLTPIGNYDTSKIAGDPEFIYLLNGRPVAASLVVDPGVYTVIAKFTPVTDDFKIEDRRATLTIRGAETEVSVTWDSTSFVYNGLKQHPTPTFTDADGNELDLDYTVSGVDNAINVSNYTITITLTTAGYAIKTGDESTPFSITKATLPVPTLKEGDIIYNGSNINLADYLDGYDSNIMEIVSGGVGLNAESYSAVVKFKTDAASNCSWQGSSGSTVNVKWEIKKATAIADWGNNYKFVWNGNNQYPELVGIIDVCTNDQSQVDLTKLVYEGDINVSEMGSYTVSVRVPSSEDWFKNYTLENTSYDFVIVPSENVELVSIVWDNLVLTYNGDIQHPTYTVVDMDGNEVSADVLAQINFELPDSKWAGDYTAKANVKAGAEYFIRSGGTCAYKIVVNAAGEGKDPTANNSGNGGDGTSFIDKLLASHFPLWQVAVMAVSALLAIIFIAKAAQYGSRAKKANGEAKKIKSRAYAALLPIFSTETVALGLSNQIWSIIAFALAGLALAMFVVALIMRSSWKKAELAKENAIEERDERRFNGNSGQSSSEFKELKEQLAMMSTQQASAAAPSGDSMALIEEMRREMEQRRREDEERHRQEMDAMKMMFANMMGRQQGEDGFSYASMDDTDMLVQRVIAGLLPAVQQMMPEPTAYLAAPQEQNEELLNIVAEQNAQMQAMSEQMSELQSQLAAMHDMADAVIMPDSSEDINALSAKMDAMQAQIANLGSVGTAVAYDSNNDEIMAEMNAMREQIEQLGNQPVTVVAADNGEDMKAMADEMNALRAQVAKLSESQLEMSVLDDDEDDDFSFDDEEEWDCVLDEDDDDFVESVLVEKDGTVRKVYPNFRMRLKQSSDKNREWYTAIKNLFCSQKGITYRVYKRVEKIRYQGNVIAVIGIAKRSIKLWLALKPYEYDARRYHHKDVSDKPRFVDVPLYTRVGSDRALTRAQELILALFQEQATEPRKRYTDRGIQELIFTLKYNKLLTKKPYKQLLCESIHVHDCDVITNEIAEACIESKNVDFIDDSVIEQVKLDDIDAKFQDGNRVTLDRLKKVGLVGEECTGYVVTAGQRLTKPLIVVANDFTMDAVKMIVLTGGRVIRLNKI